jgi:hypothetical protein
MIKIPKIPQIKIDTKAIDNTLFKIALDVRSNILKLTGSGRDVNHASFKPYSESYKTSKKFTVEKKGQIVNLQLEGKLLNALRSSTAIIKQVGKSIIRIADQNRNEIGARHNYGLAGMPKRYWFGIGQDDADRIYLQRFGKMKIVSFK